MAELTELDDMNLQLLQRIGEQQPVTLTGLASTFFLSRSAVYARCRDLVALGLLRVSNGSPGRTDRYFLARDLSNAQVRQEINRRLFTDSFTPPSPFEAQELAGILLESVNELVELQKQNVAVLKRLAKRLQAFIAKQV